MEHDEVYGKFVFTFCICSILYFCKKFADCKKDSASLFTRGIIKNIILREDLSKNRTFSKFLGNGRNIDLGHTLTVGRP